MKWKVKVGSKCEEGIRELLKTKRISVLEIGIIKEWILRVSEEGPYSLDDYENFNFRHHPLERNWKGYFASSFSFSGRIIYKIEDNIVRVEVVKITPDHDYKRD